jgi:outer membrane receptor protein involved in Fe transport
MKAVHRASLFASVSLGLFAPAYAQDSGVTAADETGADIVVTAQKREQRLQDVPVAITALGGADIDKRLIDDTLDLQFAIPNFVFNGQSSTLRGVGNVAISSTSESGLGYHVNGVYLNAPRALEAEFYDVDRIEVLRGPQGTLYGRNTTAGVINVITARPTDEFEGFVQATYGNYDTKKVKAAINLPFGALQQRFSGFVLDRKGYTRNLFTGNRIDDRHLYSIRSSTALDFGPTQALLVLQYFRENDRRSTLTKGVCTKDALTGCSPLSAGFETPDSRRTIFNSLPTSRLLFPNVDYFANALNPADVRVVNQDVEPRFFSSEFFASLEVSHDFGDLSLTSLTGYQTAKSDTTDDFDRFVPTIRMNRPVTYRPDTRDFVTTDQIQSARRDRNYSRQFSQELRLASSFDGPFDFLIGGYYFRYRTTVVVDITHPILAFTQQVARQPLAYEFFTIETRPARTRSWAIFGEVYYDLSDRTRLTGGLRYSSDRKSILTRQLFLDPVAGAVRPFSSARDSWGVVTGRAVLDHRFSDDVLGYVSYSRGYKAGGLNPGGPAGGQSFDPEHLNAFEAGLKSSWLGGTLTANLAGFYYDYKGLQVGQVAETSAITVNADARTYGLEAEMTWRPARGVSIDLTGSWLRTRIKNFQSGDEGDPSAIAPGSVVALDANGNPRRTPSGILIKDLRGNELPNSPEFKVNVGAQYTAEFGGGWKLIPRVDYTWQDSFSGTVFNKPSDQFDGWSQTDIKLALVAPGGEWQLRAFAKNLFNNDDIIRITQEGPLVGRFRSIVALEPRTYGAELELRF